jgi:hypothetical protein
MLWRFEQLSASKSSQCKYSLSINATSRLHLRSGCFFLRFWFLSILWCRHTLQSSTRAFSQVWLQVIEQKKILRILLYFENMLQSYCLNMMILEGKKKAWNLATLWFTPEPGFLSSILWCSQSVNHWEIHLAKFDYILDMKVETKQNPFISLLYLS